MRNGKRPVYKVNSNSFGFSHPVMLILDSAREFTKEHMVGNLVRRLFVMRDTHSPAAAQTDGSRSCGPMRSCDLRFFLYTHTHTRSCSLFFVPWWMRRWSFIFLYLKLAWLCLTKYKPRLHTNNKSEVKNKNKKTMSKCKMILLPLSDFGLSCVCVLRGV